MCVCSRAVRGTTGGVSLKSEQEDRKKTSPFDFFVTMISLVPFLLSSSSSSKVSRGHVCRRYKIWKKNEEDRWMGRTKSKWKILSFFLSVPNGVVEHEKKSRESKHIELRQAQNARFSPPASGAVEKKEHGRRYQNDASRRRRREEWKN